MATGTLSYSQVVFDVLPPRVFSILLFVVTSLHKHSTLLTSALHLISMATISSSLDFIWKNHKSKMKRIEELESKVEEGVRAKRRRATALLTELPAFRKSHLRIFLTHSCVESDGTFKLLLEGKLLIGHLDHASANELDQSFPPCVEVDPNDRNQYRGGMSEREADEKVVPIHFTHFFEAATFTFTTKYAPIQLAASAVKTKGGRKSQKRTMDHDESKLLPDPTTVTLRWERTQLSEEAGTATDAHGFSVGYTPVQQPPPGYHFHSVVAEVTLVPKMGDQDMYKPSKFLATALFPQHVNERRSLVNENDVFCPSLLTMPEVIETFFHYVNFKRLLVDDSIIVCDKLLQGLLEVERFNFDDLHHLLITKQLVKLANDDPVILVYCMTKETATSPKPAEGTLPSLLQFDMDIFVPSLFHYRVREILRRIKQREFEYTSSRTKARNFLLASKCNEELIRLKMDECTKGQGYGSKVHIPIWLALARAAPDGEARRSAQLDARLCLCLHKARQYAEAAKQAWDVVEAMQQGVGMSDS